MRLGLRCSTCAPDDSRQRPTQQHPLITTRCADHVACEHLAKSADSQCIEEDMQPHPPPAPLRPPDDAATTPGTALSGIASPPGNRRRPTSASRVSVKSPTAAEAAGAAAETAAMHSPAPPRAIPHDTLAASLALSEAAAAAEAADRSSSAIGSLRNSPMLSSWSTLYDRDSYAHASTKPVSVGSTTSVPPFNVAHAHASAGASSPLASPSASASTSAASSSRWAASLAAHPLFLARPSALVLNAATAADILYGGGHAMQPSSPAAMIEPGQQPRSVTHIQMRQLQLVQQEQQHSAAILQEKLREFENSMAAPSTSAVRTLI
jgi:hypothetical protein